MMIFQGVIIFKTLDTYASGTPMEGINSRVYECILTVSRQLDKTEFGPVNQTTVWLITDIFLNCISHLQKSNYFPILAGIKNTKRSSASPLVF